MIPYFFSTVTIEQVDEKLLEDEVVLPTDAKRLARMAVFPCQARSVVAPRSSTVSPTARFNSKKKSNILYFSVRAIDTLK